MAAITKKRKANHDDVIQRICECIVADAAPFHGEVESWEDLKTELSILNPNFAVRDEARDDVRNDLVTGVNEGWFTKLKAGKLIEELLREFAAPVVV